LAAITPASGTTYKTNEAFAPACTNETDRSASGTQRIGAAVSTAPLAARAVAFARQHAFALACAAQSPSGV
jgi:hypothetical protein